VIESRYHNIINQAFGGSFLSPHKEGAPPP